jgi:HSP20 family protein
VRFFPMALCLTLIVQIRLPTLKTHSMTLVKHHKRPVRPSFFDSIFDDLILGESFQKTMVSPRTAKMPVANVQDNPNAWVIELIAPGWNKEDLNLAVNEGVLSISTEMKESAEESEKNYTRKEFHLSTFERKFQLPENVNEEEISAEYNSGVLFITIPKMDSKQTKPERQIKIG